MVFFFSALFGGDKGGRKISPRQRDNIVALGTL